MTHVFHRHTHGVPPTAARGEGIRIYDAGGKSYIDASGGAAVSCLGHSHPKVIRAIKDQVDRIAFAHTSFFTNEPMERLADRLVGSAEEEVGPGFSHVYFVSGGSEAVEAALKLARQYFWERGETRRRYIVARRQSYHGNTLGGLSVGGNFWRRDPFEPILLTGVRHIAPCYEYRDRAPDEDAADYGRRVADELEATIRELGEDAVAAFICEPVVGATAGAVPPVEGYLARLRAICDRYGVLLIFDEVMCGMGRTGTLHACEQEGVAPDLMAIAKGLGGGYQPVGAVLVGSRVIDAIAAGSGFFQHGHTYIGHPVACAAALAVQQVLARDHLVERCAVQGARLRRELDDAFSRHENVGEVRGRGLFQAIELVADRSTKEPFDPGLKLAARVRKSAMELGMLCYPMGGTIDGARGDHVLLAPPFIISDDELDLLLERLVEAVDVAVESAS
jgi:adenosylmethionine-8-amino-7-oxononanoate aminotransferase